MVLNSFNRKFPQNRDKHRQERNIKRFNGANIAEDSKE